MIEENDIVLNIEEDEQITLEIEESGGIGTNNYEELVNLPKLNGKKIIGNMEEEDPTVPGWAKDSTKPQYTAEEVGAVNINNKISFNEIDRMFNVVFGL